MYLTNAMLVYETMSRGHMSEVSKGSLETNFKAANKLNQVNQVDSILDAVFNWTGIILSIAQSN